MNGEETEQNEYPWQVGLYRKSSEHDVGCNSTIEVFCGGTLISDRWVLTAAHCLKPKKNDEAKEVGVLLGAHDLTDIDETNVICEEVEKVIRHGSFNSRTNRYDFLLLKLARPLQFSNSDGIPPAPSSIRPICLPERIFNAPVFESYVDKKAIVTGWGATARRTMNEDPSDYSDVLRESRDLKVMSNDDCNSAKYGYKRNRYTQPLQITNDMLCASSIDGTDACKGDSGGPLVVKKTNKENYELVGVVSMGYGCGLKQFPDIYSRVTSAMDWIIDTTEEDWTTCPS